MAKQDCTEICAEEFDDWLSELFIVTEAMEYVLDLLPAEHTVLSNALSMFQIRLSELVIEGHDHWSGNNIAFPMQRLTDVAHRRALR